MLIEHEGRRSRFDPSTWIAPNVAVGGDVRAGPDCRVPFGAVLTDDGGPVELGESAIVMKNALVRGRPGHPARIGSHVIVGPHGHVNGAEAAEEAFIATGAALFPGVRVGARTEVRIHGVVHVNSTMPADAIVPIGWVAVGAPATVLPPDRHGEIWAIQRELDFRCTALGLARDAPGLVAESRRYAELFGSHRADRELADPASR